MCVCNIVFHFVYRSVKDAVLVVSFRLSKAADNNYVYLNYEKKKFFRHLFLVNSQIASSVLTGLY